MTWIFVCATMGRGNSGMEIRMHTNLLKRNSRARDIHASFKIGKEERNRLSANG
jgi:hypothetical protein